MPADKLPSTDEQQPSAQRTLHSKINQRSESVQEIISHQPDLLEKWGITLLVVLFIGLFFLAWFVNYPDTVEAPLKVISENASKPIISLNGGQLTFLNKNTNQQVSKGEVIAVLECDADYREVLALERKVHNGLNALNTGKNVSRTELFGERYRKLGELEGAFQMFYLTWMNNSDENNGRFYEALQRLKNEIDHWSQKYIIRAPINGRFVFVRPLKQGQMLKPSKLIGYINPPNTKFYAEANLSNVNIGKIDTGLEVQIRLDSYPYHEYGALTGQVSYISSIASDSGIFATIRLDTGVLIKNGKLMKLQDGFSGKAIIITRKSRLLEKMYSKFSQSIISD